VLLAIATSTAALAQTAGPPRNAVDVRFAPAPLLVFPNPTDSNTPVVWMGDELAVFSSESGRTLRATGTTLETVVSDDNDDLTPAYSDDIGSGRWLEAVLRDDETGRLYGWYHNEVPTDCPQGVRLWPRIGAALSDDDGMTWDDLGLILTPRDGTISCDTDHPMTNGGIGDFSVILDNNEHSDDHYLYFLFSSYGGDLVEQGISFARMRWIDRDHPLDRFSGQSLVLKWDGERWNADGIAGRSVATMHDVAQVSWTSSDNRGYWGPSVHWNTDLHKFIVLMSRSGGGNYDPDGIYMTYTTTLDDPLSWAAPKLVIAKDQGWYPQVVGDPAIKGTDKLAGSRARYFNRGASRFFIEFVDGATLTPTTRTVRSTTLCGAPNSRPCAAAR